MLSCTLKMRLLLLVILVPFHHLLQACLTVRQQRCFPVRARLGRLAAAVWTAVVWTAVVWTAAVWAAVVWKLQLLLLMPVA